MATSYLDQEGAFYAEKQPTDYIDWSKIGKDLSLTLNAEAKRREELKAQLDEENRLSINKLQEAPQGEHKGANQWTLEFANNGSQYLLNLNKLLKSGQMSVKDYTVAVQNMKDGTNDTFNLMKEYQATFSEKMDRYKKGESQELELWLNSQAEGYANFNKSQVYIDPSTGRVSIAMKEKKIVDGKEVYVMTSNPNQISTVNSLRNQLKGKYDKFDSDGATNSYVDALGKDITALRTAGGTNKAGQIMSIQDITSREYYDKADPKTRTMIYNFKQAETNAINSMLANPLNRSSVLTNNIKFSKDGQQYSYTYDIEEAKKNKNLILLRLDEKSGQPMPDFENSPHGKEQMELSTEWLRTQARSKYDRVQQIETYQEPKPERMQQWEYEAGKEKKEQGYVAGLWNQIYYGTKEQKRAAAQALIGTNEAIKMGLTEIDTESTPGQVKLKYENPKLNTTKTYADVVDGRLVPVSKESWAQTGAEIHGLSSREAASKSGISGKVGNFNADFSGTSAKRQGETAKKGTADYTNQINDYVNTNVNIVEDDPESTVQGLRSKFPKFRFDADTRGITRTDYVIVNIPGKEPKEFKVDDVSQRGALQQYLADNMDKNVNPGGKGELD